MVSVSFADTGEIEQGLNAASMQDSDRVWVSKEKRGDKVDRRVQKIKD